MRWWLLAGVWGLYASFGLVASCLSPLVAQVEQELDISHAAMGSVLGAWQLVYMFSAIPCGLLLDRVGSRTALTLGIALISLSALARSAATDFTTLLLSVMAFGLGAPIISTGAPKVITEWFEGSNRGLAMGVYATGPAIGGTLALTLTHSWLLPWLGDWRKLMLLWAGVGVASGVAWLVVSSLPRFREAETRRRSVGSLPQLSTMRELVALSDVRLLLALATGTFLIAHGVGSWLPALLQARGMTTIESGYWAAIPAGVGVVSALVVPRLAIPRRRQRLLFALVATSACSTLLFQLAARPSLLAGLVFQGAAATVLTPILVLTLLELPGVGERRAGTASGLFFSAAQIGGVVGPMGLGVLYDLSGGFALGLGTFTLIALAIMLGITRLQRTERPTEA
ncbi:MAG: MFS transporter [Deltaproteobacteria bacterium]|nr:MFS transporter [Deltaproteobacteria bacterium]